MVFFRAILKHAYLLLSEIPSFLFQPIWKTKVKIPSPELGAEEKRKNAQTPVTNLEIWFHIKIAKLVDTAHS